MPDVAMCKNGECSLNKECYRFTAIPNEHIQSYGMFKPNKEGKCDYYRSNKEYKHEHKDRNDD